MRPWHRVAGRSRRGARQLLPRVRGRTHSQLEVRGCEQAGRDRRQVQACQPVDVLGQPAEHGRVELPCRVQLAPSVAFAPVSLTVRVGGGELGAVRAKEILCRGWHFGGG